MRGWNETGTKQVGRPVSVFPVVSARMFKNTAYLSFPLIFLWYDLCTRVYPHARTYAKTEPCLMAEEEEAPRARFSVQLIFWLENQQIVSVWLCVMTSYSSKVIMNRNFVCLCGKPE